MADDHSGDQELAHYLGFLEAYTIGAGTMIGVGIFVLPGIVASNAGPARMISFVIAGAGSLFNAISLTELDTGMPKADSSIIICRGKEYKPRTFTEGIVEQLSR